MYEVQEIVQARDTDGPQYDHIFVAYDRNGFEDADKPAVEIIDRIMNEVREGGEDEGEYTWGQVAEIAWRYGIYDVTDSIDATPSAF
jgi:hypothetical protein